MPASPEDGARHAIKVTSIVEDLERMLLRQLAENLATGADRDDWDQAALTRLRLWRARADAGVRGAQQQLADVVAEVMVAAHTEGYALALADLPENQLGEPAPARRVLRAADDLTARVMSTLQQTPRLLESVYRQAVAAGAAEVAGGKVTRLAAAQHVLDRLLSNGVTGFRDVAGRNWSLTSYVEMAVRTETGAQAIAGHVEALRDGGVDLIQVSDSPRECPKCRPWEGKVLSLSGQVGAVLVPSAVGDGAVRVDVAGTLDDARRDGLQHPNCTHSIRAYLPGATSTARPKSDPEGYEAKQRQRAMERKVREWKRREELALTPEVGARARAKVRDWQGAIRDHVDANDLKRLRRREQIAPLAT